MTTFLSKDQGYFASSKNTAMKQVAFVTYSKEPTLTGDDKLLAQYLSQQHITVHAVLWDDAAVNWTRFDAIILRSTWDYFERPADFNEWLDKLAALQCRVWNPLPVIRWNLDKNYFKQFSENGILLPPYVICGKDDNQPLHSILAGNGWDKAVVKPAISGGAYHTWITDTATAKADEQRYHNLKQSGDVIVQVFAEEIHTQGELSLIFFDKKFSHAICKNAKAGDFRVQAQFGGTATPIEPGHDILMQATTLLNNIPEPLLYARVDGVVANDGSFLLMELELIEPSLFMSTHPDACANFYQALVELLLLNTSPAMQQQPG